MAWPGNGGVVWPGNGGVAQRAARGPAALERAAAARRHSRNTCPSRLRGSGHFRDRDRSGAVFRPETVTIIRSARRGGEALGAAWRMRKNTSNFSRESCWPGVSGRDSYLCPRMMRARRAVGTGEEAGQFARIGRRAPSGALPGQAPGRREPLPGQAPAAGLRAGHGRASRCVSGRVPKSFRGGSSSASGRDIGRKRPDVREFPRWAGHRAPTVGFVSDRDIVAAIVAGDPAGLSAAYDSYAAGLFGYCRSLLGEPADAADAVQDTFVIAAAKIGGLRNPARLRSWLYAVARNECHGRLRARARWRTWTRPAR